MAEVQKQARVFLELRQRLKSGLVVLRADVAGDPADVSVSAGEASLLIKTSRELLCTLLPPGVTLVPGSCRVAHTTTGDGLHLRLRLEVDQHTEVPRSVFAKLRVQQSHAFCCQHCGQTLLPARTFRRVLPLPTGNWNPLVDWCCHPDPFANKKLLPRQEDCLLGDTFVLLACEGDAGGGLVQMPAPADLEHGSDPVQRVSKNEVVLCASCRATLGEAEAAGAVRLYITEVTVRDAAEGGDSDLRTRRHLFLEQTLAARLVELSSSQSIFRFCIQIPSGKAYVLLWLLNTDTLLASLSDPNSRISPGDGPLGEHPSCKARGAVKVLYLACLPSMHQELTEAWEKDVGVHPLTLPLSTCREVMQLLTASTSSLPPSLRTMNSFQVFVNLAQE
ncbi:E3 ubiquitin-protein ligase E3D isoform X2 [Brienomyrus brachyistius]|uniref:E3 ubiquitin-protein ligase E3D isoform X2 n=1 Tax=Brienomyrus brachyistius TaxID=42636 RepID=UPI0020B2FF26|nr:E3 ubiquitin-protein ligase E3D isoform X2 [Brienomyrus brachyistius]